jgi:glycosyltransferase involved in cell wall biosynthesis
LNAYNEGAVIREKLINTLSLNYPRDKLEVMVLSDASSDQTDQIAREFADQEIRLLRSETRVGKSENLTCFVPESKGSIPAISPSQPFMTNNPFLSMGASASSSSSSSSPVYIELNQPLYAA